MVKIIVVEDEDKDQKIIKKIIDPFYFKYNETIHIGFSLSKSCPCIFLAYCRKLRVYKFIKYDKI